CGVVERVNVEARESAAAEARDGAVVAVAAKDPAPDPLS
nr:hypothetical protein [Tanacetum cinerariifolium]